MPEPAQSLLISASLGALVGLIRQWEIQHEGEKEPVFAGLRTFAMVAMLGCLGAYAAEKHSPGALLVTLGLLGVLLAVTQFARPGTRAAGYTTPGASVLTFFCGALVFWGERQTAVVVAALTLLLLGLKQPIHQWTRRFTAEDIRSTLQFVAITGVILPLVPNRNYGPLEAFNPWSIWLMVVLISGLGFLGYLLSRLLGNQAGITLTGLVGGLASSTATALAFSRRSRQDPGGSNGYALAIVLACTVMLGRVLVIVFALEPTLARRLVPPLLIMSIPGVAYAVWFWWANRSTAEPVETPTLSNPLSLSIAIKFALLYAGVRFLVKAAANLELARGMVALSAIAGLTDVDALTASVSSAAREASITPSLAAAAIVTGCISNTLVKAGFGITLGSPPLKRRLSLVLGATSVAGILGLLVLRGFPG